MANNTINYKIASYFDGEGFKKATQALNDNKKELGAVKSGLGEVTSAFKNISPAAEKATGAVTSLVGAFTTGGIVGGVIKLSLDGISFAIEKVSENMKAASAATVAWAGILKDNLLASISATKDEASGLSAEIRDLKADTEDALKALNGESIRDAKMKAVEIHQVAVDEMTQTITESGKALVLAQEGFKMAVLNAQSETERMDGQIAILSEFIGNLTVKQREIEDRLAEAKTKEADLIAQSNDYLKKRKTLDDALYNAEQNFKDGIIDQSTLIKNRKNISLAIAKLEKDYASTVEGLKSAHNEVADIERMQASVGSEITKAMARRTDLEEERNVRIAELNLKSVEAKNTLQGVIDSEKEMANQFDNFLTGELARLNESTGHLSDANEFLADLERTVAGKMQEIANGDGGPTSVTGKEQRVKVVNPNDFPGFGGVNVKSNEDMKEIPKPRKLDPDVWKRWLEGRAGVEDTLAVKRFMKMEERYGKTEMFQIYRDTAKWIKLRDSPNKLNPQEKAFCQIYEQDILPKLDEALIRDAIGEGQGKLLTTMSMDKALNRLLKCKEKSIAQQLEEQTALLGDSLRVR